MTVKFSVSPWAVLETHSHTCNYLQQVTLEDHDNTVQIQLEITSCVSKGYAFLRLSYILNIPECAIAASNMLETAAKANLED
jgi:hypothetical protein